MLIPNPHKIIRNSDGVIVGLNIYEPDYIEVKEKLIEEETVE